MVGCWHWKSPKSRHFLSIIWSQYTSSSALLCLSLSPCQQWPAPNQLSYSLTIRVLRTFSRARFSSHTSTTIKYGQLRRSVRASTITLFTRSRGSLSPLAGLEGILLLASIFSILHVRTLYQYIVLIGMVTEERRARYV